VKYLSSIFLRLALVVVLYSLAAVVIDPHQNGRWRIFHNYLGQFNSDDYRAWRTSELKKFAAQGPVDGLVLGSSRADGITSQILERATGRRYFNFSVPGSTLSIISSVYAGVLHDGYRPRHLILGLDVEELLTRKKIEARQRAIAQGEIVPTLFQTAVNVRGVFDKDFAEFMVRILANVAGLPRFKTENEFKIEAGPAAAADQALRDEYAHRISTCGALLNTRFARLDLVSDLRFGVLYDILKLASDSGASVDIYMTPVNPLAEQQAIQGNRYVELRREAMTRLTREAAQRHYTLHDFGSASSFGGDDVHWVDCVHYGPVNAERMVHRMLPGCDDCSPAKTDGK